MNTTESSPQVCSRLPEDFWALARRIAHLGTQGVERLEFLRRVSADLLSFSGCAAVDMWMADVEYDYHWHMKRQTSIAPHFELLNQTEALGPIESAARLGKRLRIFMDRLKTDNLVMPVARKSFRVSDAELHGRVSEAADFDPNLRAAFNKDPNASMLLLPVEDNGSLIGLMGLTAGPADRFGERDALLFEPVAETLGRAVVNRRAQFRLRERIKELTCLHGIARVSQRLGDTFESRLQSMIDLLPAAMQFPSIAAARLSLDDRVYATAVVAIGVHELEVPIVVGGKPSGMLVVSYREDHPEFAAGPFLQEERDLLKSVAHEIEMFVERTESIAAQASLAEQLRHADRLATIGQLAAGVAHELNEPLGNIMGFAQLLQKQPGLPEAALRDAEQIVQAVLHGREIVKKLLLFSRHSDAQRTCVDLSSLIRDSLYFLEARCRHNGIDLRLDLAGGLPSIVAVSSEMTQVLVNLAVNAIQAMPNGGVLTVRTRSEADAVLLTVEDTGTGMDEATQSRLFTPFFTTKDIGEGTGLGLSVVLGIVSAHGGTIHVESAKSRGSRFEIRLPRAPAENPAAPRLS